MDVGLTWSKTPWGCSLPGGLPAPPAVSVTGDIGDRRYRRRGRAPLPPQPCLALGLLLPAPV